MVSKLHKYTGCGTAPSHLVTIISTLNGIKLKNLLIFMSKCIFLYSGNAVLAKQKILSILHHCSNVHKFPAFTQFKECQHGDLVGGRPWIKAGLQTWVLWIKNYITERKHAPLRLWIQEGLNKNISAWNFLCTGRGVTSGDSPPLHSNNYNHV